MSNCVPDLQYPVNALKLNSLSCPHCRFRRVKTSTVLLQNMRCGQPASTHTVATSQALTGWSRRRTFHVRLCQGVIPGTWSASGGHQRAMKHRHPNRLNPSIRGRCNCRLHSTSSHTGWNWIGCSGPLSWLLSMNSLKHCTAVPEWLVSE